MVVYILPSNAKTLLGLFCNAKCIHLCSHITLSFGSNVNIVEWLHLKALVFLYAFEESVDCHLLSSFGDDSNLHISLFKYVLSTMGVSKESISKILIGNRFHVKLRILSPGLRIDAVLD